MCVYVDGSHDGGDDVPLRRLHHVQILAQDKDDGGDEHEQGGHAKGQRVAGVVTEALDILPEHGSDEGGDEGARVDGEVEDGEEGLQLALLLRQLELDNKGGWVRESRSHYP